MNETYDRQGKMERKNRLALLSMVAGFASLMSLSVTLFCPLFFLPLFVIFLGIALISGIIALIQTKIHNGKISDRNYAIVGLSIGFMDIIIMLFIMMAIFSFKPDPMRICSSNLTGLAKSLLVYSQDYDGKFPTPEKWCDLLIKCTDVSERHLICPNGKKAKSHYALNPNACLTSRSDMVALFETKGGWNQFGGRELISTENHDGLGCNIAFQDTHVEFVKKEDFHKLYWGTVKNP